VARPGSRKKHIVRRRSQGALAALTSFDRLLDRSRKRASPGSSRAISGATTTGRLGCAKWVADGPVRQALDQRRDDDGASDVARRRGPIMISIRRRRQRAWFL